MKHIPYKGLLLAIALLLLVSCNKEQPNDGKKVTPTDLVIELAEATLQPGQALTIPIKSGSGSYTASIPQIGIARAEVTSESVTLQGIKVGNTTLTITDKVSNRSKVIKVSVREAPVLHFSHRELKTAIGTTTIITILNGSSKYVATLSDPELCEVYFDGNNCVVIGKKIGSGTLTITDSESGFSKTINVEVTSIPLVVSAERVEMELTTTGTVSITSGSGDYTITCDKPELVEITSNKSTITLKALAVGEGTITIKDNITELTKEIELVITLRDFITSIDNKGELTLYIGISNKVIIKKGNGEYKVEVADESKVTAELVDNTITLTPKAVGESKLTITDLLSGKSVSTTIKVEEVKNLIKFSYNGQSIEKLVVNLADYWGALKIVENNSGVDDSKLKVLVEDPNIVTAHYYSFSKLISLYFYKVGTTTLFVYTSDDKLVGLLPIEIK